MILPCNATVLHPSTGMVKHVFSVLMEESGTARPRPVFVKLELNGTDSSVLLSKTAKEEQSGIKTLGLANALPQLSGVEPSVRPILVQVVKFGIMLPETVPVLEERSLLMDIALFLKELVPTDKYGITLN